MRSASGQAQLIVGTHALIQEAVAFTRLGLAIVDEQHRFGVAQRLALRGGVRRQCTAPADAVGNTDSAHAGDELSGRSRRVGHRRIAARPRPVVTKLISTRRRDDVMQRIRADVAAGRQAYWVCPLIESSEVIEVAAATETFERITQMLPDLRIGLLHGQLPSGDESRRDAAISSNANSTCSLPRR